MANPNTILVDALRKTASKLKNGATYAWGNHGACNCGHLLQVVTSLNQEDIVGLAQTGIGEWTELSAEYCETSNAPIDLLISILQGIGLTPTDIHNLEYLNNREVLERLPGGFRWLKKNIREDVILYFEIFSDMLEEKILSGIDILPLFEKSKPATQIVA